MSKQSLYENDRRELRGDYLARIADAEVDVLYVLTGRRGEGLGLGDGASTLINAYVALLADMQRIVEELAYGLRDQLVRPAGQTLHSKRLDFRAEEQG